MSRTMLYPVASDRQMALASRRRRVGVLAHVVAYLAGISQPDLSLIESGRKIASPEQLATLDAILRPYERAHARVLRSRAARSFVSASA